MGYRTDCSFDVLMAPVVGMEGFEAHSRLQDPGRFVEADDLPSRRRTEYEHRFREVVDFLIRGLLADDGARSRATLRLLSLWMSDNLTASEKSEIASALWNAYDPIFGNTTGPNSLLDWVYLILPQLEPTQAERSFRRKWLSPSSSEQNRRETFSSEMLAQAGVAVVQLRSLGYPFELTAEEQGYIVDHTVRLVESLTAGPLETISKWGWSKRGNGQVVWLR